MQSWLQLVEELCIPQNGFLSFYHDAHSTNLLMHLNTTRPTTTAVMMTMSGTPRPMLIQIGVRSVEIKAVKQGRKSQPNASKCQCINFSILKCRHIHILLWTCVCGTSQRKVNNCWRMYVHAPIPWDDLMSSVWSCRVVVGASGGGASANMCMFCVDIFCLSEFPSITRENMSKGMISHAKMQQVNTLRISENIQADSSAHTGPKDHVPLVRHVMVALSPS